MRVAVLLSGGVDSATALARLKEQGYTDIHAYYLKIWLEDELSYMGNCPWEEDLSYARAVCRDLEVPLEVVPLQLDYYERVVSYALSELRAGRTPSPDIFCNARIKFGAFYDAVNGDVDKVATGHYAQVDYGPGEDGTPEYRLRRAPDPVKDQSYFLSHLTQEQLSRVLFPIGDLLKDDVRGFARERRLAPMDRKDSQGICFLGKLKYPDFVRHYLGEQPGEILERETGHRLGEHRGYWFHTVGQRQGLGLGNGPWYVVGKDIDANVIYVSHRNSVAKQATDRFVAGDVHWIGRPPADGPLEVKLRHGPDLVDAEITRLDPDREDSDLRVTMAEPDRGVAPGQFAVFYRGSVCLGAAKIRSERSAGDGERRAGNGKRPAGDERPVGNGNAGSEPHDGAIRIVVPKLLLDGSTTAGHCFRSLQPPVSPSTGITMHGMPARNRMSGQ
jgi:tRNA-specific 2-thiouridylase